MSNICQENKEYNGWSNYPTWCVNLWLDNDRGFYNDCKHEAETILAETIDDYPDRDKDFIINLSTYNLGDRLREYTESILPQVEGMGSDLISWVLDKVNWAEIVEHIMDEVVEDYNWEV